MHPPPLLLRCWCVCNRMLTRAARWLGMVWPACADCSWSSPQSCPATVWAATLSPLADRQEREEKNQYWGGTNRYIAGRKKITVLLVRTPFGLSLVNSFLQVMAETCRSLLMTKVSPSHPLYTVHDYHMLSTFYLKARELWCTVRYITCNSTRDVCHRALSTTQLVPQNAARVYCSPHNS